MRNFRFSLLKIFDFRPRNNIKVARLLVNIAAEKHRVFGLAEVNVRECGLHQTLGNKSAQVVFLQNVLEVTPVFEHGDVTRLDRRELNLLG